LIVQNTSQLTIYQQTAFNRYKLLTITLKTHDNLAVIINLQINDILNMTHVPINLKNISDNYRDLEPVNVSIPFKNGQLYGTDTLVLIKNKQHIDKQITILAYWPNMSIKWIQLDFLFSSNAQSESIIYLSNPISKITEQSSLGIKLQETPQHITIETKSSIFHLSKTSFGIFSTESKPIISSQKTYYKSAENTLVLTDKQGIKHNPTIDKIYFSHSEEPSNVPIKITAYVNGYFKPQCIANNPTAKKLPTNTKFEAEITFYFHSNITKWRFTLHNPQAMKDNNGTWDLGNGNSSFFQSFNAFIPYKNRTKLAYKVQDDLTPSSQDISSWQEKIEQLTILQTSSGGENWQSANHINHLGKTCLEFCGYQVSSQLGETVSKNVIKGRATPTIHLEKTNQNIKSSLSVHIENFWQKFPKSIEVDSTKVTLGLFPEQAKGGFELQPGEKKSDTFYISYNNHRDNLSFIENPTQVQVATDYLVSTQAIALFSESTNETQYDNIINEGLKSTNNFFQKRELIDEYGWRNFGDLYADHETLEIEGNEELISHYNNQYDPLYGFLRRFLLTQDRQWLTLANDLADHIKNIDIYHTTQDKVEYNGGLFWHTDHYLPAETASHRTYSQQQVANAYQDHAGGGGPGGQHCYTTGLMLHYYLTGDETSKSAVLQLTKWITNYYEGSGTITDFLLAIKNKNRIDLKNIFTGKYPLDRGTGHYIIALIDSFEATGHQSYLDDASLLIKHTVHPDDNIEERHLNNIEECWFYTVFFQAVYRYLITKQNNKQIDESFYYAQNTLLHYAQWMVEHEQPYLNTPEILEYPNHTWAAQDIRKANVLYMASYFSTNTRKKKIFQIKADEIYHYVVETFKQEPTRYYTRILSILMQNQGIKSFVENASLNSTLPKATSNLQQSKKTKQQDKQNLLNAFFTTLSNTSVLNELTWLRKRSSSVNEFFIRLGK